MASWENDAQKPRGSYVRNVHPCNVGRVPDGVVLGEDGLGNLSVQTGRGSHVYGPAVNWAPVERAPDWAIDAPGVELHCVDCGERLPEVLAVCAALRCVDCAELKAAA